MPMPDSVEVCDFKVGDKVKHLSNNGRSLSPYTGTVVRIDTACQKVDVQFPTGIQRCDPRDIVPFDGNDVIEVNINPAVTDAVTATIKEQIKFQKEAAMESVLNPDEVMVSQVVVASNQFSQVIEDSVKTLLGSGYSENDVIKIMDDTMQVNGFTVQAAIRSVKAKYCKCGSKWLASEINSEPVKVCSSCLRTAKVVNWAQLESKAKEMSDAELNSAIKDCLEARDASKGWNPENEGYYQDEASVYSQELTRRGKKYNKSTPSLHWNPKDPEREKIDELYEKGNI